MQADGSNTVHRHEPPITNDPILVLHKDEEKGYVMVSKPGSVVSSLGRPLRFILLFRLWIPWEPCTTC